MKILVVEDEPRLREAIGRSLQKQHYRVETAADFVSAWDKVFNYEYDCILLDIALPGGSGLDLLGELKRAGRMGNVIIISAKDALDDKLLGLELGADDYLTKPFHLAELNARVKAVLRRKTLGGKEEVKLNNVRMDLDDQLFFVDDKLISLNRKEFAILHYLMLNQNRVVTRISMAEYVWGDHIDQADDFDFIYSQIKNIRKKLREGDAQLEIQTIYGLGYKLVGK
jgi:DNA-binding response OmpR family regulator